MKKKAEYANNSDWLHVRVTPVFRKQVELAATTKQQGVSEFVRSVLARAVETRELRA